VSELNRVTPSSHCSARHAPPLYLCWGKYSVSATSIVVIQVQAFVNSVSASCLKVAHWLQRLDYIVP